jgi:threonine synthase
VIRSAGVIARYFDQLPVSKETPIVSLGEGGTPLIGSTSLSRSVGAEVLLKLEGLNPTGSFKDRGMAVAVSRALEEKAVAVVCASTGNTGASAAAYAARAGLACGVLVPEGQVAVGKLAQALLHGGRVLEISGGFDLTLQLVRELGESGKVAIVNSINPYRLEGQKTAAFEVVEELGGAPDAHFMPVGNAGNITAYWRGYNESLGLGWTATVPKMFGWQAEGAAPIVQGHVVEHPVTKAGAIRIGNPASWSGALEAATRSDGLIDSVTDEEMITAQRSLAEEGVFVELASCAGVAGLRRAADNGLVDRGATVVCVLTGSGLKDVDLALSVAPRPRRVEATSAAVLDALDLV